MQSESNPKKPLKIFISYSRTDEDLKSILETNLSGLKRDGLITNWHFRMIIPGTEWDKEIHKELKAADIILLLVSPDFIASDYCYDIEVKRALERHDAGNAHVIPIILRPTDWQTAPFSKLQALPKDAKPIDTWQNINEAFLDVIKGIRNTIHEINSMSVVRGEETTMNSQRINQIEFVNRLDEIREITKTFYAPYLLISAPKEYGKTRLLDAVIAQLESNYFCIHFTPSKQQAYSIQHLATQILEQLGKSPSPILGLTKADEIGGEVGLSILNAVMSTPKRKVLILIDKAETIDHLAKMLLNEFLPAIEEVLNAAATTIPLRLILSGRYSTTWKQLSSKIPLTPMVLTPFDFDAVHQTVIEFNSQQHAGMDTDFVSKFAFHLMHFTGGHPGCMANILKNNDFGLPIKRIISKEDTYYNNFVLPVIKEIEEEIPEDLIDIFKTLSPLRRFNAGLLRQFIKKKLLNWPEHEHILEDRLLETYLVDNDEGFLKDEIIRRLFAIRLRKTNKERFIEICQVSTSHYETKLKQTNCFGPHIIGIEILFQKLQLSLLTKSTKINIYIKSLDEVLNLLKAFTDATEIIGAFENRLNHDWEFRFNFRYLFPDYPFEKFINTITNFRKKYQGGSHD